jgi:hypothetical protein
MAQKDESDAEFRAEHAKNAKFRALREASPSFSADAGGCQGVEQLADFLGDRLDGFVEGRLIGFRRLAESTDLADELE